MLGSLKSPNTMSEFGVGVQVMHGHILPNSANGLFDRKVQFPYDLILNQK